MSDIKRTGAGVSASGSAGGVAGMGGDVPFPGAASATTTTSASGSSLTPAMAERMIMRQVLQRAAENARAGCAPFAAAIVEGGRIVSLEVRG
jgi:hypothetical protein